MSSKNSPFSLNLPIRSPSTPRRMAFFSSKSSHSHQRSLSRSFSTDHLKSSSKRAPAAVPSRNVTDPVPNRPSAFNSSPIPPIPKLHLEFKADDSFGLAFRPDDEPSLESMSAPTRSTSLLANAQPALFESPSSASRTRTLSASRSTSSHHSQSRSPSRVPSRTSTNMSSPSASVSTTTKRLSPSARDDKHRSHSPAASSKSRSDSGHGHESRSSPSQALAPSTAPFPSTMSNHSSERKKSNDPAVRMRSSPDLKAAQQKSKC